MPKTGEDYGIYVKSVTPDGTAGVDGRIRPGIEMTIEEGGRRKINIFSVLGDRILEVNGRLLDGLSHAQVVDFLKESPPLVELVISHKVSLARGNKDKYMGKKKYIYIFLLASLEKEKEATTSTPVSSTSSVNDDRFTRYNNK